MGTNYCILIAFLSPRKVGYKDNFSWNAVFAERNIILFNRVTCLQTIACPCQPAVFLGELAFQLTAGSAATLTTGLDWGLLLRPLADLPLVA